MSEKVKTDTAQEDNPFVLSIGDLMAALLLIFILLLSATLLMLQESFDKATIEQKIAKTIVQTYLNLKEDIYKALEIEFREDLDKWKAEIIKETLIIRFKEPSIYFDPGKAMLKDNFKYILKIFFPRYVKVLYNEKFKNNIEEIRIEGHTSSEWDSDTGGKDPYFLNMELSQNRTRSVLEFGLGLINDAEMKKWAKEKITANGLSSSKLIIGIDGREDKEASRRVEFRVRTDAEKRIEDIQKKIEQKTDIKTGK